MNTDTRKYLEEQNFDLFYKEVIKSGGSIDDYFKEVIQYYGDDVRMLTLSINPIWRYSAFLYQKNAEKRSLIKTLIHYAKNLQKQDDLNKIMPC